jgi:hypothetical protein
MNPLQPSPALLSKVGSIIQHLHEGKSAAGHHLDVVAMNSLLDDPEVVAWLKAMDELALLPRKR